MHCAPRRPSSGSHRASPCRSTGGRSGRSTGASRTRRTWRRRSSSRAASASWRRPSRCACWQRARASCSRRRRTVLHPIRTMPHGSRDPNVRAVTTGDEAGTGPRPRLTVRGAVFLGVGSMVGAGIFALLGEAGAVAGAATWVSFLVAGLISTALGYTLVKFGVRYPSSGGLITYLIEAFGNGRTVGIAAWLGYSTAIVVVAAMVAVSFGDYAASIVVDADPGTAWTKVFASLIVVATALLTTAGARWIDRSSTLIVIALLAVFAVFIVATIPNLHPHLLSPSDYPSVGSIVSSVALTFFAFLGFAVISFAAGDLSNPERELPRAMYGALGITTVLYVAIALSVFGTLTVAQVVDYGPTAIAEAARPSLGDAGYAAMAVAALLATSSSVLATMYASVGFTGALVKA